MGPYIITTIIVLLVLFLALWLWKKTGKFSQAKGSAGERKVARTLKKSISGHGYVLNDFLFVADDGKSVQIDHILIDRRGVFVIETKNYSGQIYGKENEREWTQVLAYGEVKNKFYNPVKQNQTHLFYLKQLLPRKIYISPLVVFVQNNTEHIESEQVVPLSHLKDALNSISAQPLTAKQVDEVYNILSTARTDISKKEHVKNVHRMLDSIEANRCPRCNGRLVERKGEYGTFYGCENYPKCKFTKK